MALGVVVLGVCLCQLDLTFQKPPQEFYKPGDNVTEKNKGAFTLANVHYD